MIIIKKIIFELEDENGDEFSKTLEGEDSETWHKYIIDLCIFAKMYKINPDWEKLKWETKQINVFENIIKVYNK